MEVESQEVVEFLDCLVEEDSLEAVEFLEFPVEAPVAVKTVTLLATKTETDWPTATIRYAS